MTRRLWISVLTAAALLAQAAAPAWSHGRGMAPPASTVSTAASEQAPPCHEDAATDTAPAAPAAHDCYCDDGGCARLCTGFALALPGATAPLAARWIQELAAAPRVPASAPAHRYTPLRPPITAPI